ncbi:TPA: hypothetical protein NIH99_001389 [Pseudomonas aeruginosa]|nr:hypothetical protein [Pseudomonas aeruginosa]
MQLTSKLEVCTSLLFNENYLRLFPGNFHVHPQALLLAQQAFSAAAQKSGAQTSANGGVRTLVASGRCADAVRRIRLATSQQLEPRLRLALKKFLHDSCRACWSSLCQVPGHISVIH